MFSLWIWTQTVISRRSFIVTLNVGMINLKLRDNNGLVWIDFLLTRIIFRSLNKTILALKLTLFICYSSS